MKKKSFIPLLLLAPMFFMANSPAPWNPPEEYNDFNVVYVTYTKSERSGTSYLYDYDLDIENMGDKYLILDRFSVDYSMSNNYKFENLSSIFQDQCLAPKESGIYTGMCDGDYSEKDIKFQAYAVTPEYTLEYKDLSFDKETVLEDREYYRQGCSLYSFNINGAKLDKEYHWSLIIDATVKGERFTYYSVSSIGSKISFVNKSGISESDISIDGLYLVRGRKVDHTWDFLMYIGYFFVALIGAAGVFGTIGGALFIAFMVLLIFVIVPGIVILIIKPWKKRDKKQE